MCGRGTWKCKVYFVERISTIGFFWTNLKTTILNNVMLIKMIHCYHGIFSYMHDTYGIILIYSQINHYVLQF